MTGGQFMADQIFDVCTNTSMVSHIYTMPDFGIPEKRPSPLTKWTK
jgi:hypothetical protein